MSARPPPPRPLLVALLGTILAASACARAMEGTEAQPNERETADWVPLKGVVTLGRTWGHPGGHPFPAVDFEVPSGESIPVYAAGPGTVFAAVGSCPDTTAAGEHVGCNGGNGNLVDIIHPDGRRSRYLHLRQGSVVVKAGDHVCRGCLIGRSGWSGNVIPPGPAGAHLHYEELIGYLLVPPGPMFAESTAGQITYPGPGETWQDLGVKHPVVLNEGFPAPDVAPRGSCFGWSPTLVGTVGRDEITGSPGHDVILAGGGDDSIVGGEGEDRICGGAGDDIVVGSGHPDHLDGGPGGDTCYQGLADGTENSAPGRVVSCESPSYTLTVIVDCCGKVVSSQPPGISCPDDCSETYPTHTRVTLSSEPERIHRWAGCDTSPESSTCSLTMSRDRTVRSSGR